MKIDKLLIIQSIFCFIYLHILVGEVAQLVRASDS